MRRPLSRITWPLDGAIVSGVVTIEGTASDEGGELAGVEVSTDGGVTWHPTSGAERWSYEWMVPQDMMATTILTRAVDDSVNVEKPGRGISLRGGHAQTQ